MQYEAEEKRKISGFPTAKELRQAKEVAEARLKREEEKEEQIGLVSHDKEFYLNLAQQKRKAKGVSAGRPTKVFHPLPHLVRRPPTFNLAKNSRNGRRRRCEEFLIHIVLMVSRYPGFHLL
jgi:hypothetical protein